MENLFSNALLGFRPCWYYKPTNAIDADIPGVYTCDKILNLSTIVKIRLKCGVIDGSAVNGIRERILFNFSLDKPAGYKVVCQPETVHFKKTNKSVWNIIVFYSEDDSYNEVDFNGEKLTFI